MKSTTRIEILGKLSRLAVESKRDFSVQIQNQLALVLQNQSGIWAGYKNLSDEPGIEFSRISKKISWVYPKMNGEQIEFRRDSQSFSKSNLGVAEPQDGEVVALQDIQGVVIPAVAYDQQGYRLGRGRGYYDRALARYTGVKIGVCFDMSLCEELPHEEHDVRCDQIVTEKQIRIINKSEGEEKWS